MDFLNQFATNIESSTGYSCHGSAYIMTNEDLRLAMEFMPKNCNRALTVAASGDHPLWCSLYGAKHVDTFDITYNAKCIMDIKTAALSCLRWSEYISLVKNLYYWPDGSQVLFQEKIANLLPKEELEYMESGDDWLFSSGGMYECYLPKRREYRKLKKIVKEPYNFIQTDIAKLGYKLTESYDFIHLSNIMELVAEENLCETIIVSLMRHVNPGGRILFQHLLSKLWEEPPIPKYLYCPDGKADWRFIPVNQKFDSKSILERVR